MTALRILVLFLVVAGAATACGIHDVEEATPGDGGDDSSSGDPGAGGGSGASGPGTGGSGAAMSTSAASTGPGTGGAGGNTSDEPGFVNCGDAKCDGAVQKCCSETLCQDLAVPCAPDVMSTTGKFSEMQCDDQGDCPMGQACCVEPHDVVQDGLLYQCKAEPCGLHPSCATVGGDCDGGLVCAADATEPTGAKCVNPDATVACGAGPKCDDSTPVCCVAANGSSCVAYGGCVDSTFECDEPSDCGMGYVCCGDAAGASQCAGACNGPLLCDDAADCNVGTCSGALDAYQVCQ